MPSKTIFSSEAVAIFRNQTNDSGFSTGYTSAWPNQFGAVGSTGYTPNVAGLSQILNGVQSVGISSTVEFEQLFELGHLEIFENVEGVASCEVTMERVLPAGSPTLFELLADVSVRVGTSHTYQTGSFASDRGFSLRLVINPFGLDALATGTTNTAKASVGLQVDGYTSNYSITAGTDSPVTESLTMNGITLTALPSGGTATDKITRPGGGGGTVFRRQDVDAYIQMISGATQAAFAPNAYNTNLFVPRAQSVTLSIDVGREDLLQLGQKGQYLKYATFPLECTAEIEYNIDATPTGVAGAGYAPMGFQENAIEFEPTGCDINPASGYLVGMRLLRTEPCGGSSYSTTWVTVSGAKLVSQNFSGGGTDGSVLSVSESYNAYNAFKAWSSKV
jgi:hypothetical protein